MGLELNKSSNNIPDHAESQDASEEDLLDVIHRLKKELEIQTFLAKKYKSDYQVMEQFFKNSVTNVEKRNEELLEVNLKLERFAFVVAHDLKAPLRNITSFSDLLQKHLSDTKEEEPKLFLDFILKACNQMSNLVNGTLEYATVKGKDFKVEKVNLNRTYNNVIQIIDTCLIDQKFEFESDILPEIVANKAMMYKLFANLIQNGVKYNQSEIKKITINYEASDSHHILYFKDNGIGLNGKDQQAIFEMFTRLHNSSEYEGTGIGLAMCKRIVENHNGEISVSSEDNKGSIFKCTISKNITV